MTFLKLSDEEGSTKEFRDWEDMGTTSASDWEDLGQDSCVFFVASTHLIDKYLLGTYRDDSVVWALWLCSSDTQK